jgi:alanine-glyoxylate transaminase/(R)-3-amino-2-methylpropionate-pyruvate transaminase
MARLYTGNFEVITLRNSFHGLHFASMSLTGISTCRHALPPSPGILHVHNPDQYRGFHGTTVTPYVKEIDALINTSTSGNIAAFVAEPIQGYGGVIPLPSGYLQGAFERVRAARGMCIVDEVQTGFGRTGSHFWGFETQGVTPDVVVMGKGIGNGYPLAAVVAKRQIAEAMSKKKFFNTYGSNPVACAAGRAVLRVIEEDGLQQNAKKMGALLMEKLTKVKERHDIIGDVRGQGLMVGVELVKDPLTKEPALDEAARVAETAKELGLIVRRGGTLGNVLRINPPICIQEGDVEFIADVLEKSCNKL